MKKIIIGTIILVGIIFYFSDNAMNILIGFWPLILLLCPIMHMFMHGKHHHHNNNNSKENTNE
ncbi:DUF2933 domain-containing protein [Poseidonibacter ostreae]|uniref:DUF2933 domain-containing protein n=1 Tax=Poseidonibacter ostreae TaxID=2654171 RepID=A0A6L4WPI7_9BACT|nr:DUF2933 domain-containing protein [Poseidonibacter ostreae]KAB7884292.1 DUF2933 domain-containing protein [Poseidonibacter ostreae]KAB7885275.1 DUF2933 domain-containing protein [Poseidonibacter ostreae]KAB7891969.1 DUF2933 domain-containing protein [Poseidonibacter ostreae]